jgi:two-component system response regulator FixJ
MNSKIVHLVDDDEAIRHSASFMLRHAGYTVKTYKDGIAFLDAVTADMEGCILLDVRMPGMDGLAVQAMLKQRGIKMPVIILTGHGDVPVAVEAMKGGAIEFLEKPY